MDSCRDVIGQKRCELMRLDRMGKKQGLSVLMLPGLSVQHSYLREGAGLLHKSGSYDLSDKVGWWVTPGGQPGFWTWLPEKRWSSRLGSGVHMGPPLLGSGQPCAGLWCPRDPPSSIYPWLYKHSCFKKYFSVPSLAHSNNLVSECVK